MKNAIARNFVPMLAGGFLVALGLAIGLWSTGSDRGPWEVRFPGLKEKVLHASSATAGDSFAMATGVIDKDAEGVFVLDFYTGTLQCSVLNRRSGKFTALFKANVARDLGIASGGTHTKNAAYQMVTGFVDFEQAGGSPYWPGRSAVYVLDAGSGRMVAYGIPWQRGTSNSGRVQMGLLRPIDVLQVRDASVPDE